MSTTKFSLVISDANTTLVEGHKKSPNFGTISNILMALQITSREEQKKMEMNLLMVFQLMLTFLQRMMNIVS